MNVVKTIDFELTDVFNNQNRCIYAFIIKASGSTFLYIGITGSSNGTGISSPLKRLARHIAPSGNTFSIFHENDRLGEMNETSKVRFIYTFLPESVQTYIEARRYEAQCVSYFSEKHEITLLNTLVLYQQMDIYLNKPLTNFMSNIEQLLEI